MELEEQKNGRLKSDIEWYLEQADDSEYKHYIEILMRVASGH